MRSVRSPLTLTSRETAARFIARREHGALAVARAEDNERFRAALLACLGRLTPKFAPQLTEEVGELLGEDVSERRVYRWLRRFVARGEARRTADGYLLEARRHR